MKKSITAALLGGIMLLGSAGVANANPASRYVKCYKKLVNRTNPRLQSCDNKRRFIQRKACRIGVLRSYFRGRRVCRRKVAGRTAKCLLNSVVRFRKKIRKCRGLRPRKKRVSCRIAARASEGKRRRACLLK